MTTAEFMQLLGFLLGTTKFKAEYRWHKAGYLRRTEIMRKLEELFVLLEDV